MEAIESKEGKMKKVIIVLRVRPLLSEEVTQRSPWKLSSKSIAVTKTSQNCGPSQSFIYDRVYGTKGTSFEIYEAHVKDIIKSVAYGVNGTVIAYGQPGSGKTFTMRGNSEEKGLLVLAVQDVFRILQEEKREFLARVSYYDLSNEEFVDLLASRKQRLDVHEDAQGGIVLKGLREEIVGRPEDLLSLLEYADARSYFDPKYGRNTGERPHSIFRMVIESRSDQRENLWSPPPNDAVQVSVLNLVEVTAGNSAMMEDVDSLREEIKADRGSTTLDTVMSELSKGAETKIDALLDSQSKLRRLLKQSLGGNSRTCFVCHISPAMVHLDASVATMMVAAKARKVMNCLHADEIWREKTLLKCKTREFEELQSKCKVNPSHEVEDVLNRRDAILMIELERQQMLSEDSEKGTLVCCLEPSVQDREMGPVTLSCELDQSVERLLHGSSEEDDSHAHKLQDAEDELIRLPGLSLTGKKRKRSPYTEMVAEKFARVNFRFQRKHGRELQSVEAEGITERNYLKELKDLMQQQNIEHLEFLAKREDECRNLQQLIAGLEKEKVFMEERLQKVKDTCNQTVESLKGELAAEKARQAPGDEPAVHRLNVFTSNDQVEGYRDPATVSQDGEIVRSVEHLQEQLQENGLEFLHSLGRRQTDAQSCISPETGDQKNQEEEAQYTYSKRKHGQSKAPKGSITSLLDEKDGLVRGLQQIKVNTNRSETGNGSDKGSLIEGDRQGDDKIHQLLAAAVDDIKTEVESTVPMTEALLELVLESFRMLASDVKSFQEGVSEIKALSYADGDLSKSLERAKLQVTALRRGKLASDEDRCSMKSELAKLECVVERQSGVLKVLSDNESLLGELSSARTAMKEAAGASEVRLLSIQQDYKSKLKKVESECEHWKFAHQKLEEKCSEIQVKLTSSRAEVQTLMQALEDKAEVEKEQKEAMQRTDAAEAEVARLTQILEKFKTGRKQKYSKSRQGTVEAGMTRVTNSLDQKAVPQEVKNLEGELTTARKEVERLGRENREKDKAHQDILTKLAASDETIAKLKATWEDKVRIEAEQKHKILRAESEVARVTKLLDDALLRDDLQQRELVTSQEKLINFVQELEELKDNYGRTLDRLVESETKVASLTETIANQLRDRGTLEQDCTNFLISLKRSESEVRRLSSSLEIAEQEIEEVGKEFKRVSLELSMSQLEHKRLTEKLAGAQEEMELRRGTHRETLDHLSREQERIKQLNHVNTELPQKLTKEPEESKARLENVENEKERNHLKENNGETLDGPCREQENETLENQHNEALQEFARSESKVMHLTENLGKEIAARSRLKNEGQRHSHLSTKRKERSTSEGNVHEHLLRARSEQERRKELEKTHQMVFDRLLAAESELARLRDIGGSHPLDTDIPPERDGQVFDGLQKDANVVHDHQPAQEAMENTGRTDQNCPGRPPSQVKEVEPAHLLGSEREKEIVQECQETCDSLPGQREERQALEEGDNSSSLHHIVDRLSAFQSKVTQLTKELTTVMQENRRLETENLQIRSKLTREQEERNAMERRTEELIQGATKGQEERELLGKAHEMNKQEERRALLDEAHEGVVQKLAASETRVPRFTEGLAEEMEGRFKLEEENNRLMMENRNIIDDFPCLNAEATKLRETLAKELEGREDPQRRLNDTNAEFASVSVNLSEGRAGKEILIASHIQIQSRLMKSKIEVQNLTRMLEEIPQLTKELQFLQIKKGRLVAEHLTHINEQGTFEVEEMRVAHLDFDDAKAEAESLNGQREQLYLENMQLHQKIANSEADNLSLRDLLEDKTRREEEHKAVQQLVTDLQVEAVRLKDSLEEKLTLQEKLKEMQVDSLNTQGDISKLTKKLRVSRRTIKEQKQLINRLSSTQAEVLRLTNALGGRSKSYRIHVERDTTTDPMVTGLPCHHCARNCSQERTTSESETVSIRILMESRAQLETQCASAELQVSKKAHEIEEVTKALEDKSLELSKSEAEVERLSKELEGKSHGNINDAEGEQLIKALEEKSLKLSKNEAEVERLSKELEGKSLELSENDAEVERLTKNLEENLLELSKAKAEVERLSKKLEGKSHELSGSDAEIERLTKALEEKSLELSKTEAEVERLSKELDEKSLELSGNDARIERLTKALEARSSLDERFKRFHFKLSEAGLLKTDKSPNGFQTGLEELPAELHRVERELAEQTSKLQIKEALLTEKEQVLRSKESNSDAQYKDLKTIIALLEKERDALREQYTTASKRLREMNVDAEKLREFESSEKRLKSRCHKAEKDAADVRAKLEKLEEAAGWLARDKGALDERLACCELQLSTAREASQSVNKDLELSHHQRHVLSSQHQTEMAALYEELSLNKSQKAELELELTRLLGSRPSQANRPLQEVSGFSPRPLVRLTPQWPYSNGPGPVHPSDTSWRNGKR